MLFTIAELNAFVYTFDNINYRLPTSEEIELCVMRIVMRDLLYK
jgi:hypothetical protein